MTDDAYKQVREFLKVLEDEHGITLSDIKNALRYYKSVSRWSDYFAKTLVGGIAMGFLYVMWQGIVHFFHKP